MKRPIGITSTNRAKHSRSRERKVQIHNTTVFRGKERGNYIMECKNALINLINKLSDKSIRRLCNLAEYLYIYVDGKGGAK